MSINGKLNFAYYSVIALLVIIIGSTYLNLHQMENKTLHTIEIHSQNILQEQSSDVQQDQLIKDITNTMDQSIKTARIKSIIILVVSIVISFCLVTYLRKILIGPIVLLCQQANIMAEGDLSKEDIPNNRKDEIGQLIEAFNKMKQNLTRLIKNVQNNAADLGNSSQKLAESIISATANFEQNSKSIGEASNIASTTMQQSNESAFAMEETAVGINRIAESNQNLFDQVSQTNRVTQTGLSVIKQGQQQMHSIYDATNKVSSLMSELAKQTEEIEVMTKVITGITEQTNLLALNAAIEAARAGEYGKGFAVVADEVRKLAEQSKDSVNTIKTITDSIKQNASNVEIAAVDSFHSVNEGIRIIQEAGESFTKITNDIQLMTEQIQESSASSEQISASAEQVTAAVNDISIGLKTNANELQRITEISEEQTIAINQISVVANTLNEKAKELRDEIQHFKL